MGDGSARRFRRRSGSRPGGAYFGRIALGFGEQQPETGLPAGLREFSMIPAAARLWPFGLLRVRGGLGSLDLRRLHRRYADRLHRRYGLRPGRGWAPPGGGAGLGYLGVAEVRE